MRVIETERTILRQPSHNEVDTIYQIATNEIEDESFSRASFDAELAFDASMASQPMGQHFGRPAVYLKETNRYIGFCTLMPRLCTPEEMASLELAEAALPGVSSIEAEVGWAISNQYRRRGLATECGDALVRYGLDELRLPRIVAFTEPDNEASIRVMRSLGMHISIRPDSRVVVGLVQQADI